jgi:hypothetical protein
MGTVRNSLPFRFEYNTIRKISAPEDVANDREVYSGHAPASSFLALDTDENVRDYMVDAEGKQRRRPTQVHKAIRETLDNNPQNFCILNGGIVIVARGIEVDDKNRVATLIRPSIINGSQTQGVLREYLKNVSGSGGDLFPVHVKFEIIVTTEQGLIAEISIARNFQNDVMTISIAGRLGQLEELEKRFRQTQPGARLRKSETDLGEDFVVTEKLLQVITALIPEELWPKDNESDNPNKVFTYSMKAKCLKDFQKVWSIAKGKPDTAISEMSSEQIKKYQELYQFYLDICGQAWELYEKWKQHPDFKGTRLRAFERDDKMNIVEVPDGIVFPILASLSAFAVKPRNSGWVIRPPDSFNDKEIIRAAADVYKEIANSNPWNMGKSKACYSALYQITSIFRRLSR